MGFLLNKTPFLKMRGRTEKLFDLSLRCIIRDLLGPCPGCRLIPVPPSLFPVMVVILAIFPSLCAFPQVQPGPVCRLGRDQWPGGIRLASLGSLDYENSTNSGD
jgi:hypothetical protein